MSPSPYRKRQHIFQKVWDIVTDIRRDWQLWKETGILTGLRDEAHGRSSQFQPGCYPILIIYCPFRALPQSGSISAQGNTLSILRVALTCLGENCKNRDTTGRPAGRPYSLNTLFIG